MFRTEIHMTPEIRRFPERLSDVMQACIVRLVLVAVLPGFYLPQSTAQDSRTPDSRSDTTTLVVMASGGPVFVRMQILVDGHSYRSWVTAFLGRKLDINRDSRLTLSELELIPEQLQRQATVNSADQILRRAAGGSSEADHITVDQFTQWFSERLSRNFNIIATPVRASEAVRLATLIDQNGDGGVSEAEVRKGAYAMRFRDLDDDETFSASELMPYRDPRNQRAAIVPDVANLPFVQLTDQASVTRTSKQLRKRYGDGNSIPLDQLRFTASDVVDVDRNGDGVLSSAECDAFLESPAYHFELDVRLSDRSNSSHLVFRIPEGVAAFCTAESTRRGRANMTIDGMRISVRARGGGTGTRSFFTSFLLQRMSLYDEDKNNYLSAEEFPQMQQQMAQQQIQASFEQVDLNGDEMLFRDELMGFIERDAISTQSRIEVSVRQDGKTLFSLLDENADRRLTQRELQEGFERLAEYDTNTDGRLMEAELGTAYVLEIGLAQSEAFRSGAMGTTAMMEQSADAVLPGVGGLSGPEWFQRMDRNQDGDVSYREFLGPRDAFLKLDQDGDRLVSAIEAEQME